MMQISSPGSRILATSTLKMLVKIRIQGDRMKTTNFASACFALATFCPAVLADQQCPPLRVAASVEMISMPSGRVVVPMTVAGEKHYFWIGTATPYTSITASVARAHEFPREHSNIRFVDTNGDVSDKMTTVPSFGIGHLLSGSTKLLMVERDYPTANGITPDGTLGADFLRAYDVDLDFGAHRLNLISRDHCNVEPVYWPSTTMAKLPMLVTDDNKISFKMTLDGHDLQTILSTNTSTSTIRINTAKTLFDIDNNSPDNKPAGKLGDGTPLFAHRFQSLTVEGLNIANPKLVLLPSRADEEIKHLHAMHSGAGQGPLLQPKQPELTLGMAELKHLHVYIDYHHQMIYMTPANEPASPAPASPAPANTAPAPTAQ